MEGEFGSGFSVTALKYMRMFYHGYPNLLAIGHAVRDQSGSGPIGAILEIRHASRDESVAGAQPAWEPGYLNGALSWTHCRALLKIERRDARDFYEIEAIRNGWSARQLERQINSLLFERLLKSRDKDGVLALANEGLIATRPEEALISKLQYFLLELGSGFAFVGRQVRLTLDGDHFYPDLVFYHVKLKCYVVVDLRVDKLTHADLGQMQMYVNYYDREIAGSEDHPAIGLILCADKNDAMVRYVLDDRSQQIFARRYQFQLPSVTMRMALR